MQDTHVHVRMYVKVDTPVNKYVLVHGGSCVCVFVYVSAYVRYVSTYVRA